MDEKMPCFWVPYLTCESPPTHPPLSHRERQCEQGICSLGAASTEAVGWFLEGKGIPKLDMPRKFPCCSILKKVLPSRIWSTILNASSISPHSSFLSGPKKDLCCIASWKENRKVRQPGLESPRSGSPRPCGKCSGLWSIPLVERIQALSHRPWEAKLKGKLQRLSKKQMQMCPGSPRTLSLLRKYLIPRGSRMELLFSRQMILWD